MLARFFGQIRALGEYALMTGNRPKSERSSRQGGSWRSAVQAGAQRGREFAQNKGNHEQIKSLSGVKHPRTWQATQ